MLERFSRTKAFWVFPPPMESDGPCKVNTCGDKAGLAIFKCESRLFNAFLYIVGYLDIVEVYF